jgi:GntR family transcriptional regulator
MATATKRGLGTPLYHQIYLLLYERIRRGEFEEEARLPTEARLCEEYGVSRMTIRRTLRELEHDQVVTTRQGVGTFVRKTVPLPALEKSMDDYFEMAERVKSISNSQLLRYAYVVPPPLVRSIMDCVSGEEVLLTTRVRRYKGTPFAHLTIFTRADLARQFTRKEMERDTLFWLLRRKVTFTTVRESISATLADTETAAVLDVKIGSPLLAITWDIADETGQTIEHASCAARPDLYHIEHTLHLKE